MSPAGHAPTNESSLLLAVAGPGLYRTNVFHVTQLPVEATRREINRQRERDEAKRRLGRATGSTGGLRLGPPPSDDEAGKAVAQLDDPVLRLIHELFWFWPRDLGEGASDEALIAVRSGDVERARDLWSRRAAQHSEAMVSVHNLAVLTHAEAIELELGDDARAREADGRRLWGEALGLWRYLLEHESFWSQVSARVRALHDPRLTTGTPRRLRESLPLALLVTNGRLAVALARDDPERARAHMDIIAASGFDDADRDQAIRLALEPIQNSLASLCSLATDQADAHPEEGEKAARSLLEQAQPLLATLDVFVPEGEARRDDAHDEVVQSVLGCQISYARETDDWETSRQLLEDVAPLAGTARARTHIDSELQKVTMNAMAATGRAPVAHESALELFHGQCWFCKNAGASDETAVAFSFRRFGETADVRVPRCDACRSRHTGQVVRGGLLVLAAPLAILAAVIWSNASTTWQVIGVVAVLLFLHRSSYVRSGPGQARSFPAVRRMLDEGWTIGATRL